MPLELAIWLELLGLLLAAGVVAESLRFRRRMMRGGFR